MQQEYIQYTQGMHAWVKQKWTEVLQGEGGKSSGSTWSPTHTPTRIHFAGSQRGARKSLYLTGPIEDLRVQTPIVDTLNASGVLLALSICPPPLQGQTAQWHSALRPHSVCLPTQPSAKAAGDSRSSSYRGRSAAPNCGSKPSDGASSGARRLHKEGSKGGEMPGEARRSGPTRARPGGGE